MSIAVSAVAKPSRVALGMIGTISIVTALIGILTGAGYVGELSFSARSSIALGCVGAGLWALCCARQIRKTHHIDISGIGQIRLAEDNVLAAASFSEIESHGRLAGEVVSLMDDSTLWSFLLILRFKGEDQQIKTLVVLPDSVDNDVFRTLSVACRWIAAHRGPCEHTTT